MADMDKAVLVMKPRKREKQRVRSQTLAFRAIEARWTDDEGMELYLPDEDMGWGGHWLGLHIDMAPRDAHLLAMEIETCLEERRTACAALLAKLRV